MSEPVSNERISDLLQDLEPVANNSPDLRERVSIYRELLAARKALDSVRRNAYIRGFMRGFDKKSDVQEQGPQTYERIRTWAEGHAISYCDQFEDAEPALPPPPGSEK